MAMACYYPEGGGQLVAWRALLPDEPSRPWQALLLGAALAGAATVARQMVAAPLGHELPFITYFPALIIAATLGGMTGGVACLLLSTVAALTLFLLDSASPAWAIGSFWVAGGLIIVVAAAMADSVRELRRNRERLNEAQAELRTMVGELAHRNKNALTVIMSIVRQSARNASSADEAAQIINERLTALARAQEVVLESQASFVSLKTLLETTLAPFGLERFAITPSSEAAVEPELAPPLALLLHEMATNALKHGALSETQGRVLIDWTLSDGKAHVTWRETDGPAIAEPSQQGFGTRLLSAALAPFGGHVERRFKPDGVVCDLSVPATPIG
jgi:two-component sensor histidine kinase